MEAEISKTNTPYFFETLQKRVDQTNSLLCVGLDPHSAQLPEGSKNAQGALDF